jgi:protein-disulfide isomerase
MAAKSSGGKGRARAASTRPTLFYVVLGAIALAGVSGLAYVALRPTTAAVTPPAQVPTNLADAGPPQPYVLGSPGAPVQILEFADFECPACGNFATITEPDVRTRIIDAGLASFAYYDFPLPQHRNSYPASHAAACADEQGRFWEMHDRIYGAQDRWSSEATANPKPAFRDIAQSIGLDVRRWESCYDTRKYQQRIDANVAEAVRRGVNTTPTFIINGSAHRGSMGYDELKAQVDAAAARPRIDTGR